MDSGYGAAQSEPSDSNQRREVPKPSLRRPSVDPHLTCLTCHEAFEYRSELFEHLDFHSHAKDIDTLEPEIYYRPESSRRKDPPWLRKILIERYHLDPALFEPPKRYKKESARSSATTRPSNILYLDSPVTYRKEPAKVIPTPSALFALSQPPKNTSQRKSGFFSRLLRRNGKQS